MRKFKWVALVLSGGVMLQLASCAPLLVDLFINAVISQAAGAFVASAADALSAS